MRYRIGVAATVLLACALSLQAQQRMFKIQLNPSGTMVSLDQPVLMNGKYVFHAWPHGEQTALRQAIVLKIVPLTGPSQETIYQINLNPSGTVVARDVPTLKGTTYVFHSLTGGNLMSLRQADVKKIIALTGDDAFWARQRAEGETSIGGNLALEGTNHVVSIGTPPTNNTAQAGRNSLSAVGGQNGTTGINGAPVGNWQYQGTPGVADAYAPANATMNNGVPTMPAATSGAAPPTQSPQ
jgi:hypothetical protein